MSDFWLFITCLALYLAIPLWTVIKEERQRTANNERHAAHARAMARLQAKYNAVPLGHRHGKHEVIALGRLNDDNFYLVRTGEDTFTAYALIRFDGDGKVHRVQSAYARPDLSASTHLDIGKRNQEAITHPAVLVAGSSALPWHTEDLHGYRGEIATDVIFTFADRSLARVKPLVAKDIRDEDDRCRHEAVEADQRREQAIYERRQKLLGLECWDTDAASLNGVFKRFADGDTQHRDVIEARHNQMMANYNSELDKLNFHALPDDGRRMFLPVFLGIRVGSSYPVLDLEASYPQYGELVYICRNGPADAVPWREKAIQIDRYLGDRWTATELDGTRIKLSRLPSLPAKLPFEQRYLRHSQLFLGIDIAKAQPFYVPLTKMTHTLVCGQTGSGKSVGLNQLQRSLLHNLDDIAEIAACDLKGGVDLARFAGLSPKIKVVDSYADMHDLAERWVSIMKARFADMRAKGETNTTGGYRILIVDEFSEIGGYEPTKEEKPRHNKLIANLALLAQQGRAAGIRMILQTQAPTADYLPTMIMKNLATIMCYRMNSRQNISAVFAGYGDSLPADPASFKAGEYLLANGATGELAHIRTTACHEHDIEALKACLPPAHAA